MSTDPDRIWLQNAKDASYTPEGRLWAEDKVWPDDPEDGEPTEYVRADLVAATRAEARREALEEAARIADDRADKCRDAAGTVPEGYLKSREIAASAECRLLAAAIRAKIGEAG